ncbi:hypothetical protein GCM10022275_19950 [Tessaracoccus defluvii]
MWGMCLGHAYGAFTAPHGGGVEVGRWAKAKGLAAAGGVGGRPEAELRAATHMADGVCVRPA